MPDKLSLGFMECARISCFLGRLLLLPYVKIQTGLVTGRLVHASTVSISRKTALKEPCGNGEVLAECIIDASEIE